MKGVLIPESNNIQVSVTGGDDYEIWMNFANNAAVLTMSNTFAIFYLLAVMHITDRPHYKIISFSCVRAK